MTCTFTKSRSNELRIVNITYHEKQISMDKTRIVLKLQQPTEV